MGNEILKLKEVSKSFGGLMVLHSVSFDVLRGEILGLIGPNGAGKTTLFNIITGFLRPDTGYIFYSGKKINKFKTNKIARLGIARTFQIVKPLNELSVYNNIRVSVVFGKGERKESRIREHVRRVLEITELEDRSNTLAKELNLPTKKKLEFAKAIASSPKLLLLDEVTAGLNPSETISMLNLIRKVKEESGMSIVVVEHNMQVIQDLCDRVIVLNFGRKIYEGTPMEAASDKGVISAYLGSD